MDCVAQLVLQEYLMLLYLMGVLSLITTPRLPEDVQA